MTDTAFEDRLFGRKVIDNRTVSMTDALKYLLKKEEFRILDVAVGYFYISGLFLLKMNLPISWIIVMVISVF